MSEVEQRMLEEGRILVERTARRTVQGKPSDATTPENAARRLEAWAILDVLDQLGQHEARNKVLDGLSRAVMEVIEAVVISDESEPLEPLEAVRRIATSFIHAQNSLRMNNLDGLFLWNTTEAKAISAAVGADKRGGGLLEG